MADGATTSSIWTDDQTTAGGLNNQPNTATSYEDVAYGGAGRAVLIGNTGGDRLIDWVGEFLLLGAILALRRRHHQSDSGTVNHEYLLQLSKADGADHTRANDAGQSRMPCRRLPVTRAILNAAEPTIAASYLKQLRTGAWTG